MDASRSEPTSSTSTGTLLALAIGIAGGCMLLCCIANALSIHYFGESLSPLEEDIVYINDTERDLLVIKCVENCQSFRDIIVVPPGDQNLDYLYRPKWFVVADRKGTVIGCVNPPKEAGVRVRLSEAIACPPELNIPTAFATPTTRPTSGP